jgi:hypothetical protein
MKSLLLATTLLVLTLSLFSQVISTNRNPVSLESNLLFNAQKRFTVTQTGSGQVELPPLFNGSFEPAYSSAGISTSSPTVITISGLPGYHIQAGAWVGWTTRYWPARRFKIEGYETYYYNKWITIVDYSNNDYNGADFLIALSAGAYTQLKFTFYEGTGTDGRFGLSEIYFIHPEATTPYAGLIPTFNSLSEVNNNILIGKTSQTNTGTKYRLDVAGPIRADEVVVNTTGADFVFEPTYQLIPLKELEAYLNANRHLPGIATAAEMQENGVSAGEMQTKLLQKVEELTLYAIELNKKLEEQAKINKTLQNELKELKATKPSNKNNQ